MKKKFAIVFLSLCLVLSLPFAAHANIVTATGRYLITAVKHVAGGAKVTATNTATGAKHVATHGVSAPALGFAIGAGLVAMGTSTGVGLAFQAITGLALDGVDWVLDPANNAVKYKNPDATGGDGAGVGQYYWISYFMPTKFSSADAACASILSPKDIADGYKPSGAIVDGDIAQCMVTTPSGQLIQNSGVARHNNPAYDPDAPSDEYKYLPIEQVAAQVISNAEAGNTAAQKDIEDFVTNLAQNGDLDNELDNAPDITQPENPEEPQECPSGFVKLDDVCVKIPDSEIEPPTEGEEPLFCDSSEFTKKVCDWIDWTQTEHDEPEPDSGKVDIIDKSEDLSIDNDRIDFSNQCPAPTPINTSVGGFPVSTELNYQPLCDFFEMLNPFVVGMGGISSALIIAGGARRG